MLTEAEAKLLPVAMVPARHARFDPRAQSRAAMNADWVKDFRELLRGGADLEPGVFFHEPPHYWCGSGFHRGHAYLEEGHAYLPGRVVRGTLRDAILFSAASNRLPGCLRRTNEDKRRAVALLLDDAEWCRWNESQIAEHCGVSRHLVQALKEERAEAARRKKADAARRPMPPGQQQTPSPGPETPPPPAADEETRGRRLGQLPRSARKLLERLERAGTLRRGLAKELNELAGLPESVARAAAKVVRQAAEINENPIWWVQDALRRRAEGQRRR